MYHFIGKQVRVHLYTHEGITIGAITGRVADVAAKVEVAPGMKKDLALVVDIEILGGESATYTNSDGHENEGWFAIQDIEMMDNQFMPGWSNN